MKLPVWNQLSWRLTREEYGGTTFFKPKSNTTWRAKGSKAWRFMILHYGREREGFMKRYLKRSNVESTFSSSKIRLSPYLRSGTEKAKRNELFYLAILRDVNMVAWRGLEWTMTYSPEDFLSNTRRFETDIHLVCR